MTAQKNGDANTEELRSFINHEFLVSGPDGKPRVRRWSPDELNEALDSLLAERDEALRLRNELNRVLVETRKERDRLRKANAGWERNYERVEVERSRYREALKHYVKYGAMVDTTPTLGGHLGDGTDYFAWSEYLKSADRHVRDYARRALNSSSTPEGLTRPDGEPFRCRVWTTCTQPVVAIRSDEEMGAVPYCAKHDHSEMPMSSLMNVARNTRSTTEDEV